MPRNPNKSHQIPLNPIESHDSLHMSHEDDPCWQEGTERCPARWRSGGGHVKSPRNRMVFIWVPRMFPVFQRLVGKVVVTGSFWLVFSCGHVKQPSFWQTRVLGVSWEDLLWNFGRAAFGWIFLQVHVWLCSPRGWCK